MFIPLGTDRLPPRRPTTTLVLIVLNLLVFIGIALAVRGGLTSHEEVIRWGSVSRGDFHFRSLVTSVFLHDPGGLGHVGFNMLFLWVFGQAVESRMGSWWFGLFYLFGGAMACLAHMVVTPAPAIGASGAVASVSGAYLVLFPRSSVRVLLIFILIGVYNVPAIWFIAFYIAIDLLSQASSLLGRPNDVANAAHLGGYAFGFSTAMVLLAVGVLPRTELDMLFLVKQWRRRREMRAVARTYGSGFEAPSGGGPVPSSLSPGGQQSEDRDAPTRRAISQALRADDGENLRSLYQAAPDSVILNDADQADLGNRLLRAGEATLAARAYADLLQRRGDRTMGPGGPSNDFRLLLASILVRRLRRPADAIPHLEQLTGQRLEPDAAALLQALRVEAGLDSDEGSGRETES